MRSLPNEGQGGQRVCHGYCLASGVPSNYGSADWICQKVATGQYAIRFLKPFKTNPTPAVSSSGSSIIGANIVWGGQINIYTYSAGGTPADAGFGFSVAGR